MSDLLRCPDCGTPNDAAAESCRQCNFPLRPLSKPQASVTAEPPEGAPAPGAESDEPGAPIDVALRRFRPVRPRRPDPTAPIQVQLWLLTGVAAVVLLLWYGAHGFWKANQPAVQGAKGTQQQVADAARAVLEKDSTNVEARVALANVLYDTANWPDAIVQYRAAMRLDPKRTTTIVDLGVCYYNIGQFAAAESLFQGALALDPHQAIALFNLGILAEGRQQWKPSLEFYHRALQADPPEGMKPLLLDHMKTVMGKLGATAPAMPTPAGGGQ